MFHVIPPSPGNLAYSSQPPASTTAGTAFSCAAQVQDTYGNVITSDASAVTLTLSSGTFEGGSTTATAPPVNGVATFNTLKIDAAATGYTLKATDASLTS